MVLNNYQTDIIMGKSSSSSLLMDSDEEDPLNRLKVTASPTVSDEDDNVLTINSPSPPPTNNKLLSNSYHHHHHHLMTTMINNNNRGSCKSDSDDCCYSSSEENDEAVSMSSVTSADEQQLEEVAAALASANSAAAATAAEVGVNNLNNLQHQPPPPPSCSSPPAPSTMAASSSSSPASSGSPVPSPATAAVSPPPSLVAAGGDSGATEIQEVWQSNLYAAFMQICHLVSDYPFVAMDTEFPGIVAKPLPGLFNTMEEYKYQLVKCNVDMLKMIQLGVTLFDAAGNRPEGVCTWQFNFKFSLNTDLYAEDSIDLLMHSGLRFDRHSTEGIEPAEFAEMLLGSGLVLMDNVTWLTFHSAYDFGYLLRQLTCVKLPESEAEFLDTLKLYFPNLYDIKYLMASTESLNGGLQKVANDLQVKRIGAQHQAGSDSLLTGQVFFKMYEQYFQNCGLDDVKYNGHICGLGGVAGGGALGLLTTPGKRGSAAGGGAHGGFAVGNGSADGLCADFEEMQLSMRES